MRGVDDRLTATEAATPPRRKPSAVDRGRGLVAIGSNDGVVLTVTGLDASNPPRTGR